MDGAPALQKGALRARCAERKTEKETLKENKREREREGGRKKESRASALKYAPERRAQGALCREKDRERET